MINNIKQVVDNNLCISCGACVLHSEENDSFMIERSGIFIPNIKYINEEAFDICPGKGYSIVELGNKLFPYAENYDIELGRWKQALVAHSTSDKILKNASSGGVMTGIANYLLENNYVNGVVSTIIEYGENGPRPRSFIATSVEELIKSQGSKYAPVPIFDNLGDLNLFEGKLLFIGTPCQIAALRLMQDKDTMLKEKIPLTIGNFCGGYRNLTETDKIISRAGFNKNKITSFRYRGEGQPGSMLLKDIDGNEKKLPYPGYARMTGVIKHFRCRLCVDATAELADFACGDAWIPKYINTDKPWSIILARSSNAVNILNNMREDKELVTEDISVQDIKKSQVGNLVSKKVRQESRMKLYRFLGYLLPIYDGGYYKGKKCFTLEMKVHISYSVFNLLEKLGLYKIVTKIMGRYPKEY